jgi:hypothetical protein
MAARPSWERLVPRVRRLTVAGDAELDELRALLPAAAWRRLYLDLPFDEWSFDDRFGPHAWADCLDALQRWCLAFPDQPADHRERHRDAYAFLGLLLLTLLALRESQDRRLGGPAGRPTPTAAGTTPAGGASPDGGVAPGAPAAGGPAPDAAPDAVCARLVASEPVRSAIRAVYAPAGRGVPGVPVDPAADPKLFWRDSIDFDSLAFHRHGTTSIILRGTSTAALGRRQPFALKLIILPFLRLPRIERSTGEYRHRYGGQDFDCRHLVRVWASSSSWILMDLVDGRPLADLDFGVRPAPAGPPARRPDVTGRLNLGRLRAYGLALFDALDEMDRYLNRDDKTGRREAHADLTPSNIMVAEEHGRPFLRLIDLGPNYLRLDSLAGREGEEAAFVAPEVRADSSDTSQLSRADLYSVGQLLVLFCGVRPNPDRIVPDELYAGVPMVARLVEDLIDERPERRLLLHSTVGLRYAELRQVFEEVVDAAIAAEADGSAPSDERWLRESWRLARRRAVPLELLRPLAGVPWRLWRVLRAESRRPSRERPSGTPARTLLWWSALSALAWAVTVSVILLWLERQLGVQWGGRSVEVLQRTGHTSGFPVLDGLRRPDYRLGDLAANWPSLAVGLSYAMAAAKYYQNLFAAVSPIAAGWHAGRLTRRAVLATVLMRSETVVSAVLILPLVLVEPRWWPLGVAAGQIVAAACNWAVLRFVTSAFAAARDRGLSAVPRDDRRITGLSGFTGWPPTSIFYAAAASVIGTLVYLGRLHDIWVYASAVIAINLVLFYAIKCGSRAGEVRVVVTRAVLAAERLRYLPAGGQTSSVPDRLSTRTIGALSTWRTPSSAPTRTVR